MKKLLLLTIIIMFLLPSLLLADEFEFGISLTPMSVLKTEEDILMEEAQSTSGSSILSDYVLGLHAGYSFGWLFYASADANAMPPWWVAKQTATYDESGNRVAGVSLPAFVSFFDVGVRPTFGNFIAMAEVGINHFYIYQGEGTDGNKLGVNARIGLGYSLSAFSINACASMIFSDFETMAYVFEALANNEDWATEQIGKSIIPSIALYLHL